MSSVHESTSSITVYGGQHTSACTITVTDMANNIGDSSVVLLRFMRFDRFKTLVESDHLHSCCEALTQNRISTELRDHGFHSGKMFVRPEHVMDTVVELRHMAEDGRRLCASHVAVSICYEQALMCAIKDISEASTPKRCNRLKHREVLVVRIT